MQQRPKDPQRCRALSQNDREMERQIQRHWAIDKEEWRKLRELRDQRSALYSRLENLQAMNLAGQGVSTLIPKIPGAALGGLTAIATIEIPIIESQLEQIEIRITTSEQAIAGNRNTIDRYRRNQKMGYEEMEALHCIF